MENLVVIEMQDGVASVYEAPEYTDVLIVDWDRIDSDPAEGERLRDLLEGEENLGSLMPAHQLEGLIDALKRVVNGEQ